MQKELFNTANKEILFIVEANLDVKKEGDDGVINKIMYTMVQMDGNKKAVKTLKFWQDLPECSYLMGKIKEGAISKEPWYEFKSSKGKSRHLDVSVVDGKGKGTDGKAIAVKKLRFQIRETGSTDDQKDKLFFDIESKKAKIMANWIYKHVDASINAEHMDYYLNKNMDFLTKNVVKGLAKTFDFRIRKISEKGQGK